MPLIPLLLGIAPTIASWVLGDKSGSIVEKVTGIARDVLGTDDPSGIQRAIAADPNLALQFQMAVIQAEAEAKRQEKEAEADIRRREFETLEARIADVASARSQTVELAKAGSAIAWGAPIISVLITFGFFAMLYLVIRQEIPESSQTLANIMLGSLGTSFTAVVGYWVGSSAGSAQKTNALEKIARG